MQQQDAWAPEEVSPRDKLMSFIVQRVKQGASKEQLLDKEISQYIDQNQLPSFFQWDVAQMIDWAMRKFSPPDTDE